VWGAGEENCPWWRIEALGFSLGVELALAALGSAMVYFCDLQKLGASQGHTTGTRWRKGVCNSFYRRLLRY